ncbi:MAG: peptidase M61, partial [Merismopedia sp. SIO2A8]|nr:peptidase M61 [Merismopedia sp. SIO2A8]
SPKQLRRVIESVVGCDLSSFFDNYINGTAELPFNEYLEPFGLQLIGVEESEPIPFLGIITKTDNSQELIKFVEAGSPAGLAGVDAGL